MGTGHLLRHGYSSELEVRIHYANRFLNYHFAVFDCRSMALGEADLMIRRVVDLSTAFT